MSYIGNIPTTVAFLVDTFSGDGSDTTFTLSQAPATTSSILVAVSGVVQDPSTYSVSGTTLTFSGAPPSGSSNISVRFLGIPASGVATTAYRTLTTFTATSGQTTFSVPSYTAGYIDVYRNGVKLGTADFTATSGTSVVLASGATAGDLVETVSFFVSSVLNAIPAVANAVTTSYINDGAVTKAKMAASSAWAPAGTVVQVVQAIVTGSADYTTTTPTSRISLSITPSSTSSKIMLFYNAGDCAGLSSTNVQGATSFYRNGSSIRSVTEEVCRNDSTFLVIAGSFLDSPSSTSAQTYAVFHWNKSASGTFRVGDSGMPSILTAMEIAG
jgi:hypothetical protein